MALPFAPSPYHSSWTVGRDHVCWMSVLQPGLAQILREREGVGESSEKRERRGKSKAKEVGRGGKRRGKEGK